MATATETVDALATQLAELAELVETLSAKIAELEVKTSATHKAIFGVNQ